MTDSSQRPRVVLGALHFAEYACFLAEALAPEWDVLLVLYADNAAGELPPGWMDRLNRSGVRPMLLERPGSPRDVISNARRLGAAIREFAPRLIHLQEVYREELCLALMANTHLPMVLTVHDPEPHAGQDAAQMSRARKAACRWYLRRRAQALITHGRFLVAVLQQALPRQAQRIHSIPHGPLGQPLEVPAETVGPQRLLFFGRIQAYKGLGHFVAAVMALRDRGQGVIGVVAGRGDDLARHRVTMSAAGCFEIHDKYIPATEIAQLFAGASAVVLPYTEGTQSGVAAMALGHGRPVVATSVGSIPELVRHDVNGLLVPPGDIDALTSALQALTTEHSLRARLAEGARALRAGELSWRTIAAQTSQVYAAATQVGSEVVAPYPARTR